MPGTVPGAAGRAGMSRACSTVFGVSRPAERPPLLLVVRHGLTQWNSDQRWQGRADVPLSEEGVRQARDAAKSLASEAHDFVRVVASDLQRAIVTAEALAAVAAPGLAVERDARWGERDVGPWSGCTTDEIERRWPGELAGWREGSESSVAGVERHGDFEQRVGEALDAWLEVAKSAHRPVLVVAHGGVLRALDRVLGSESAAFPNLSGRWFGVDRHGRPRAIRRVHLLDHPKRAGTSL